MRRCSILGEREIPPEKRAEVREKLMVELEAAVAAGFTWFLVPYVGDLGPLCADLVAELRSTAPKLRLILEAVFPRGGQASGGDMPAYDGVLFYDRERSGERDMEHYMVAEAERTVFLYFRDKHIRDLAAMNYARLLSRDMRLCIA